MEFITNCFNLSPIYFNRVILYLGFVLLISVFTVNECNSQDFHIQARVIDSTNNQPVSFVTVYNSESRGTISDDLGFFRFQIKDKSRNDSLFLSCVGYKQIAISYNDLDLTSLDTIYMSQHFVKLDAVEVSTEFRKAPGSKQIIRNAITTIPRNYPDHPVLYTGYYREYIKEKDAYINLLESIIELEDKGISYSDDFSAGMLFKRMRPEFAIDKNLMRPYDNKDKFIPYSVAPTKSGNELVLLRSHDPVRNFDKSALYFIDCLETKFIQNHNFKAPKITYLDERPYYQIGFRNKKDSHYDNAKIYTIGTIFIDGLNFGIKKINYKGFAETVSIRKKLFELSLEYVLKNDLYHLNYLSFNNLFNTRNFCVFQVEFDKNALLISFNRPYNHEAAQNRDNYSISWKGQNMLIKKVELEKVENRVKVVLLNGERMNDDILFANMDLHSGQGRVLYSDKRFLLENLSISIENLTDLNGEPLMNYEFNDFYQYREFFVRESDTGSTTITSNLVNMRKPVFETRVFGEMMEDTIWLNTPLISEITSTNAIGVDHKAMLTALENIYLRDEKTQTDLVYIHTDREVYAPEDTLWFKAYIRNKADLLSSDRSQTLYVKLTDAEGKIVEEGRFYISGSDANGQFQLDHQLSEGVYYLTGYSSWMMNFIPEELIYKQILVKRDVRNSYQLVASYNKKAFFPGDTIRILVNCFDELDKEIGDVNFSYNVVSGNDLWVKGKSNTSSSGTNPLIIVVPDSLSVLPEIRLDAKYKEQILDTLYTLPVNYEVMVDFYPEGGHLVNGLKSRVAIKSHTPTGEPLDFDGEIVDQNGNSIRKVSSEHDGMGMFEFTPKKDHGLSLKLNSTSGNKKLFPLPQGVDSGWQLGAEIKGNSIDLNIRRKNTDSDSALITVSVRGYNQYYKQIRVNNRESLHISTEDIPPGLALITLYDNMMLPRAEVLVWNEFPEGLKASMGTSRKHYIPRDEVSLHIDLSSRIPANLEGSYSLSIVDDQLCSTDFIDEPDIRTTFLLSPEIKGRVHNPAYYMKTGEKEVRQHLDLLLMCQGWRDFTYLENTELKGGLPEPVNRDVISGRLLKQQINRNDLPSSGSLSVYYRGVSENIPLSKDGRFSFLPEFYPDYINSLFLIAVDEKGKKNVSIQIDSSLFERNLHSWLRQSTYERNKSTSIPVLTYENITDKFSAELENHRWIEEVKIHGKQKKEIEFLESTFLSARSPGRLEIENSLDPYEILMNMGLPVTEEIVGSNLVVQYNSTLWASDDLPAIIYWLVNDMPWDYTSIKNLNPEDIASLFVVYFPETQFLALYGGTAQVPKVIVSIHTKPMAERDIDSDRTNTLLTPKFIVSKKFYNPLYNTEEKRKSTIPDLRKTIHWEPYLEIDENGKANLQFYNGDRYTRIKCTLEGITDEGIPVYSEYFFNTSLMRE